MQEPRILCCIPEKEKRGKTDNRVALKEILRQNVRDPAGARAPALWRRLQGELSPPPGAGHQCEIGRAPQSRCPDKMPLDKMPPDKMPRTVERFFLNFLLKLFQFVVMCTLYSSELLKEKKNRIKYYRKVLFKIPNTDTLFIETHTRVKQLNEFNAVK